MRRDCELEKLSNKPHSETPMERLSYFLKTMGWLVVFLIGFLVLLALTLPLWTYDAEWLEYCQEYYPELSTSACKAASGGLWKLTSSMFDGWTILALPDEACANVLSKLNALKFLSGWWGANIKIFIVHEHLLIWWLAVNYQDRLTFNNW